MANTALKLEFDVQPEEIDSHLQGNLQNMFDALYQMGIIDPVLEMDWSQAMEKAEIHRMKISSAIQVANYFQNDIDKLMNELRQFDETTLGYLAMEVAREFADFHSRKEVH
jgi:hypothetical protein